MAGIPEAAADTAAAAGRRGHLQGHARSDQATHGLLIMALKDMLVWLDQSNRSFAHLRLAADLARRHGSVHDCALRARVESGPACASQDGGAGGTAARRRRGARSRGRGISLTTPLSGRTRKSTASRRSYGVATDWRMADGEASRCCRSTRAMRTSASSMPRYPAASTSAGISLLRGDAVRLRAPGVARAAGEPVATLGAHVAVAWNSSRASARASMMRCRFSSAVSGRR